MDFENTEWTRTDDMQWRKQLNETEFHLVEVREFPDGYVYVSGIVDIELYDDGTIESIVSGYYSSMEEFESLYPETERNGILAECIFEQTHGMELSCFGPYETEELAEANAEEYIWAQKSQEEREV